MKKEIDQTIMTLGTFVGLEATGYAIAAMTRLEEFTNQKGNFIAEIVLYLQNSAGISPTVSLSVIAALGVAMTIEAFDQIDDSPIPVESSLDMW